MEKEILINNLMRVGWHCEENFISGELCEELVNETKSWNPAQVGRGPNQTLSQNIRNDEISWIDPLFTSAPQKAFLEKMNAIKAELNRELYLGIKTFECHFARYRKGGFYKKHLDQHQESKSRILSCIVYLNSLNEGGELIIYNRNDPKLIEIKISPKKGLLICFLSDQIYHEVLTTKDERQALTGWFRNID